MKKLTDTLITFGALLIIGALVFTIYNLVSIKKAGDTSDSIVEQMDDIIPDTTDETPDYKLNPDMGMPESSINGVKCIGRIDIEALNLSLPVIAECTRSNLKLAPCLYSGSAYTDDMVIAGHNYRTHFRNIGKLKQGDEVKFTDMDGNVFTYTVDAVENLQPTDVENMTAGEWPLTLFTCNSSGSLRVTVRCDIKTEL